MRSRSAGLSRRWAWPPVRRSRRARWRASPDRWRVSSDRWCVSSGRGSASSDRGSATVWTVGAVAVLCAVFGAVLSMGQAVVVRHRAAGAADLAALAAADHWSDGGTAACARADRVARAQSARLVRCEVEGQISDVTASSGTGPITAEVRSRAGPAGSCTRVSPVGAHRGGRWGPPPPPPPPPAPPGPPAPHRPTGPA
ncbi:Rv3654c family TadE-like protein, partial [Streptomyces sp. NPDC127077]|uniref:Rv3654c family TadE-like protein n=1 Tax=Streptomyces sp. NPDC127077 TaxID=3347131 RepID=UPI00365F3D42